MTTAVVLLDELSARSLTTRIQGATEELAALLIQAHEGEAWRALGYDSWSGYIKGEFDFSRQRSYQLLDHGRVMRLLGAEEVSTRGRHAEVGQVTEADAREVRRFASGRAIEDIAPAEALAVIDRRREAIAAKPKRHGHAPLGLSGWLANMREDVERLEGGFDMADDPIANLDHESRRDLERTATKCWEFWQRIIVQLAEPVEELARDEFESA